MPTSLNQIDGYSGLTECLAGFQAVQSLNQNKAFTVRPHENGGVLPLLHDASRKRLDLLRIQGLTPLHGHIDILDCENLLLQHYPNCSRLVSSGSKIMRRELACLGTRRLRRRSLIGPSLAIR